MLDLQTVEGNFLKDNQEILFVFMSIEVREKVNLLFLQFNLKSKRNVFCEHNLVRSGMLRSNESHKHCFSKKNRSSVRNSQVINLFAIQ